MVLNLLSGKTYKACMVGCNGIEVQCHGKCPCKEWTGAKSLKLCSECGDGNNGGAGGEKILYYESKVCGTDGTNTLFI